MRRGGEASRTVLCPETSRPVLFVGSDEMRWLILLQAGRRSLRKRNPLTTKSSYNPALDGARVWAECLSSVRPWLLEEGKKKQSTDRSTCDMGCKSWNRGKRIKSSEAVGQWLNGVWLQSTNQDRSLFPFRHFTPLVCCLI
jgi:hypothetical protein